MRMPADQRRQQLFDVARERFSQQGFHATSMDEIAEAAGVTKPVLYQHFPSKRALYVELLEDTGRQLLTALAEARAVSSCRPVSSSSSTYSARLLGKCWYSTGLVTPAASAISSIDVAWKPCCEKRSRATSKSC